MSPGLALLLFSVLLIAEGWALYFGQRRLFWASLDATGSKLLAYFLAFPGTALHEAAHYIMCLVLGVPAGDQVRTSRGQRGRVSFFYPKESEDGSITLGSVPHAATDPLRGALIAVAPVLLVPPLFAGLSALLLGTAAPTELWPGFLSAALWQQALWLYLAFSCGQAAFPSPGDHIGVLGGLALIILGGGIAFAVYSNGGTQALADMLRSLVLVLAVPAAAAASSLGALEGLRLRKRRRSG